MFKIVIELPFDKDRIIHKDDKTTLFIRRPSVLKKRYEKYDKKKNFQIWMKEGVLEFKPNHLRTLIDLNLRVRSRPDLKEKLLLAFDSIYYEGDPLEALDELITGEYANPLNSLSTIGILTQLFIIEQEYCYPGKSKFDPPTLFFQGWVRQFIDNKKEIDILSMSVGSRQPPSPIYTRQEDKNHKKYVENPKPLWYIDKTRKLEEYFEESD